MLSGRLTTIGVPVERTTTHLNGRSFDAFASMCGTKPRHMDEVTGLGACGEFAAFAPAHLALAFEYVGDGFLLAVMVDAGLRARLDDEDAAPQARLDAERRRERRLSLRTRRLRGSGVEALGTDDR